MVLPMICIAREESRNLLLALPQFLLTKFVSTICNAGIKEFREPQKIRQCLCKYIANNSAINSIYFMDIRLHILSIYFASL